MIILIVQIISLIIKNFEIIRDLVGVLPTFLLLKFYELILCQAAWRLVTLKSNQKDKLADKSAPNVLIRSKIDQNNACFHHLVLRILAIEILQACGNDSIAICKFDDCSFVYKKKIKDLALHDHNVLHGVHCVYFASRFFSNKYIALI